MAFWTLINGHSLAGAGSFPNKKSSRDTLKSDIFKIHIERGLQTLDSLAKTQSYFRGGLIVSEIAF